MTCVGGHYAKCCGGEGGGGEALTTFVALNYMQYLAKFIAYSLKCCSFVTVIKK